MVAVPAPPIYKPMLAVGGPIHGCEDEYAFEPKWDGWRALVTVHGGAVEVRTRTGRLVRDAVPELVAMAEQVGERSAVLDGELVAHQGTPASFYRVGGRMATRRPSHHSVVPLTFMASDVLWLGGDVTGCDHRTRRALLESLNLSGPSWCTSPSYLGSGADLFAACARLGPEGVVAKRLDGHYYPGQRRGVWVTMCRDTSTCRRRRRRETIRV